MNRHRRVALLASLLSLVPAAPRADAAVFHLPPVTIQALTHEVISGATRDCIYIPGPGYTSSGFTSDFGTGDVVRVRVEAPPGKMFRVRAPASGTSMSFNVFWVCTGGLTPHLNSAVATFENLHGVGPINNYQLTLANEIVVEAWYDYVALIDFEFTAFVVDIAVDQALAHTMRTYGDVQSYSAPSIFATAVSSEPNFHAMQIVDIPVSARSTSWGRIKTLYR